ncbi:Poly [ADP-ribose] polymerase [Pseudolycoriella hygida]|uniref:Poly [ADP-ribose] polymerase n=1 Tax=Pseudolycoriella hygida TaxID=35572 RepID=A0A9Q0MSN6_9DIPT|nr:Poly [ADP-ribose] polymerase [Pseudolycoriella hygida]
MEDLPFKAEYAKTARAGCKGCKQNIGKDTLRLARMVQSAFHDGKQPNWFHEKCFFIKQRPSTTGDIGGFDLLRMDDQKRITEQIANNASVIAEPSTSKGRKRPADANVKMTKDASKDFGIEYAVSSRAECKGCEIKISKGEIRIKKTVFDTEIGMKYGGQALWHHYECFAKLRSELGWFGSGDQLPGFSSLNKDDQAAVKKAIPPMKMDEVMPAIKKPKVEVKEEKDAAAADAKLEKLISEQNKEFYKIHDKLKDKLKKTELIQILEKNKQEVPSGTSEILLAVADILTFGALKPCQVCKGQYVFRNANYICTGNVSAWVKCENILKEPPREPARVPSALKTEYSFLDKKFTVKNRATKYVPPTVSNLKVKKEEDLGPKVQREKPPLYKLEFGLIGKLDRSKDEIKKQVEKLGGKLVSSINEKMAAVISKEAEVEKMSEKMQNAKSFGIQVVPVKFLDEVIAGNAIKFIKTLSICDWGTDPALRIPQEETRVKSKSMYTKSIPKSVTYKLKNGSAVDPESGLQDVAHVFKQGKTKWFAVLNNTDIQKDKNSYYKMQLLESDNRKKYYIFRSWGRIGTTIGSNKIENFSSSSEAIDAFKNTYYEKTGNHFGASTFNKIVGGYYPMEVDYGNDDIEKKITDQNQHKSELLPSVQELVKLLFDLDTMKKAMLEFEIDLEKMPLGKLSRNQLSEALKVLQQLSDLIKNGGTSSEFIGLSNQFYTLIPHDFGVERPPVIDQIDTINSKTEMIESLMELEVAYSFLQTETDDKKSPLDGHYKQLNTDLKPISKDTEEFAMLEKYVRNTHAKTHDNFELEIEDIFKVERAGEKRRYKPFKKIHNRKLLWHGSRLTNFVGILSNGLKIAPPEAPVSGYMFGKGVYFADMVSKSANYCVPSSSNNTGLMLLCEVALGDMFECKAANYITKLPKGTHSVKGCGKTFPNPEESHVNEDGVEVPFGKPMTDTKLKSSLLYNEYIVYDVAQINVKYLFKLNFKHKY